MKKYRKAKNYVNYYWMRYIEPVAALFIMAIGGILAYRVAVFYGIFAFLGFYAFFLAMDKRSEVEKPS